MKKKLSSSERQKLIKELESLIRFYGGDSILTPLIYRGIPPAVQEALNKWGDMKIKRIEVARTPIKSEFETILNWISFGTYNENKKKLSYDKMFHLFLILELEDHTKLRLEKNQVVSLKPYVAGEGEQIVRLRATPIRVPTLNEWYANGINQLISEGKEPYLYDGINNNCQYFINAMLDGNHANVPRLRLFVMQNTEEIIGKLPALAKGIIGLVTDLGSFIDNVLDFFHLPKLF